MSLGATPSARIEDLLAHRDRVRSLARALSTEGVTADDVEQDAWLVVLRMAGRTIDAPRAWLSGVVRNVARNAQRAHGRRVRAESLTQPPEAVAPVDEAVARAEMHELVVRAVLALEEPFRAAVILRHFEDLPPREIAERLGVPVETVRSRVRRGVARVRAALDARFDGDRRRCSAALLALSGSTAAPTPSTKGVLMASTAKKTCALACALLLLAGAAGTLVLLSTDGNGRVGEAPRGDAAAVDPSPRSVGTRVAEQSGRRRVDPLAVEGGARVADSTADPTGSGTDAESRIRNALRDALKTPGAALSPSDVVHVTNADGQPVAGARVEVRRAPAVEWPSDYTAVLTAMLTEPELLAQGITDAAGGVRLPELSSGTHVHVRVAKDGHGTATTRRNAAAGGVAVAIGDRHDITGTVRFVGGEAQAGLIVLLTTGGGPPVVHYRDETDRDGHFAIADAAEGRFTAWVAWPGGLPVQVGAITVPDDRSPELAVRVGGTITGRVRHAVTGDAVAGVRLLALGASGYLGQTTTDTEGVYELRLLGDVEVKRLTAWKEGMAEVAFGGGPLTVEAGVERVADLDIFAGGTLVGVARGPDGPLEGLSVLVWTSDHGYITNTNTETRADGSYVVEGLRPGLALVLVSGAQGLVHPGQPRDLDRWRALLENDLDPRCGVTIVDGGTARLDVTMETPAKRATAAR